MRLGARILTGVTSPNDFSYATHAEWTEGDTVTLYLQIIDVTKDRSVNRFHPEGRRYIPGGPASLLVTFESRDKEEDSLHGARWGAKEFTREATQPFEGDPSIWAVQILPVDALRGTVSLILDLRVGDEGEEVSIKGRVEGALRVHSTSALEQRRIQPSWWIGW